MRILILNKMMLICDHRSLQAFQGFILSLHASIVGVHGPPRLQFKAPEFDFNADPDQNPAFHSNADADPDHAPKNNADPNPQP
jgi:hypothetical protein